MPRLIRDSRMVRPALGVIVGLRAMTRALGLPEGVPLVQVAPGSPAQKAGLQPYMRGSQGGIVAGDVITALGDEPLNDPDSLLSALERYQPGDKVTLSLRRDGKTRRQQVTLAASDE